MSKICSKCGYSSSDDQHFCQMCGNALDQPNNVCTNCGNSLNPGDTFCTSCGTKVNLPNQQTGNQPPVNSVPNSSSNIGDTIKMPNVDGNNMAEYDNNMANDIDQFDSKQSNNIDPTYDMNQINNNQPNMGQPVNNTNQFGNNQSNIGQPVNNTNQFGNNQPNMSQPVNNMNQFSNNQPNMGQPANNMNQFGNNQPNMDQPANNMNQFNMHNPNMYNNNGKSSNVVNGSNKLPKIIIGVVAAVVVVIVLICVIVGLNSSSSVPAEETMTTFCTEFNNENYEKAIKNCTNIQEYSKANYKKEKFKSPDEMSEAIYDYFDKFRSEFDKATMNVESVEKVNEDDDSAVYNVTLNLSYETKSGDKDKTTSTGEIKFKKVNDKWVIDLDSLSMFD